MSGWVTALKTANGLFGISLVIVILFDLVAQFINTDYIPLSVKISIVELVLNILLIILVVHLIKQVKKLTQDI